MRKANPLLILKIVTGMVCLAMLLIPTIDLLEGERPDNVSLLSILFLGCSLALICAVCTSIDKRLSAIEEKINRTNK
jgi:hypothetical protein